MTMTGYKGHSKCKACNGDGYFTHDGGIDACPTCDDLFDYVKSDYCTECDGDGVSHDDGRQCLSCETLSRVEARADRLLDEMKGN